MITVTTLGSTEVQHTTTAISSIKFQNTFRLSFIISVAKDIGVIGENKEKYISFNVKIDVLLEMDDKPVKGLPTGVGSWHQA